METMSRLRHGAFTPLGLGILLSCVLILAILYGFGSRVRAESVCGMTPPGHPWLENVVTWSQEWRWGPPGWRCLFRDQKGDMRVVNLGVWPSVSDLPRR